MGPFHWLAMLVFMYSSVPLLTELLTIAAN